MKKRILFVIPEYSHGGTNKSLENLLHFIDKEKYEVSIYSLYEDGGRLYKDIFKPYVVKKSALYFLLHDHKVTRKAYGFAMKVFNSLNFNWLYRYEINRLQRTFKYDCVIAFQENMATNVVAMLKNVRTIAWVQCDYKRISKKRGHENDLNRYNTYDKICCVSKTTMESMQSVFPQLSHKITYIYNTLDSDYIKRLSEDDSITIPFDEKCFNILSIGRFVDVKQFHIIPDVVKDIKTSKKFRWYIIGSGNATLAETRRKIAEYGLENIIILLEAKDNPYPFFKKADLHVCTSASESFSYTIAESKILHTPVVSTDFPVAFEVVDEESGWISNIENMASLLSEIIDDKFNCYSKKKQSIKNFVYDNTLIMKDFENIV